MGDYSRRTRERIWDTIKEEIDEGDAVIVWSAPNESGFEFDTCGINRRIPIDIDGLILVNFNPVVDLLSAD